LRLLEVGALGHDITELFVGAKRHLTGLSMLSSLLEVIELFDPPLLFKFHFSFFNKALVDWQPAILDVF
jgi:hypothetical protein